MATIIDLNAERAKRAACPGCMVAKVVGVVLIGLALLYWFRGR